jgi:hypothetical protein
MLKSENPGTTSTSSTKTQKSLEAIAVGDGVAYSLGGSKFLKSAATNHRAKAASAEWWLSGCERFDRRLETVRMNPWRREMLYRLFDTFKLTWMDHVGTFRYFLCDTGLISSRSSTTAIAALIAYCETIMIDPLQTTDTRFAAALAIDCILPHSIPPPPPPSVPAVAAAASTRTPKRSTVPPVSTPVHTHIGWCEVVADFNLPNFQEAFMSVLYRNNEPNNPWDHTISKLLPRAGASRTFELMIWRYMDQLPLYQTQIIRIMICGLLGNYRFTGHDHRANARVRRIIYSMFHPTLIAASPEGIPQHEWLTVKAKLFYLLFSLPVGRLCLLVMREYAIYCIEGNPALRRCIDDVLPNYKEFRRHTMEGMDRVRDYLNENLFVLDNDDGTMSWKEIDRSHPITRRQKDQIQPPPPDDDDEKDEKKKEEEGDVPHRPWQRDLHFITEESYKKIKEDSYRKPGLSEIETFRKAAGKCPPSVAFIRNVPIHLQFCLTGDPTPNEKCDTTRKANRLKKKEEKQKSTPTEKKKKGPKKKKKRSHDDMDDDDDDDEPVARRPMEGDIAYDARIAHRKATKEAEEEEEEKNQLGQARAARDELHRASIKEQLGAEIAARILPRELGLATPGVIMLTRSRITVEHDIFMRRHLGTINPRMFTNRYVFMIICELIIRCGASPGGVIRFKQLANHATDSRYPGRVWDILLRDISMPYPYTYNLLLAACGMWSGNGGGYRLFTQNLYEDAHLNQLRAIGARFQSPVDEKTGLPLAISEDMAAFYWCKVCGTIYTVGYDTIRSKKYRFTHGLRGCKVDTATWRPYCKNDFEHGSSNCQGQPLEHETEVPGKVLHLGGKLYTVCTQPRCGMLFKVDNNYTSYNSRGPRCFFCTIEHIAARHTIPVHIQRLLQNWIRPSGVLENDIPSAEENLPPLKCAICERTLALNKHIYIFGVGIYVCNKRNHGTVRWAEKIRTKLERISIPTLVDDTLAAAAAQERHERVKRLVLGEREEFKRRSDAIKARQSIAAANRQKSQDLQNNRR